MVSARKESPPELVKALEALRPFVTPEFLREWRKAGKEHGYRNLGRALAYDLKLDNVVELKTPASAPRAIQVKSRQTPASVKVTAVDRSHKDWTFVQALRAVSKITSKRAGLPICETVKLEPWHDGMVKLTATNLENWLESYAVCEYDGPAVCVADPKALAGVCSQYKSFSLHATGSELQARATDGDMTSFAIRAADDFPAGNLGTFDAAAFAVVSPEMIHWAAEACARDDSRPALQCVRIGANGSVCASDGFRLRASKNVDDKDECVLVPFEATKLIPADATGVFKSNSGLYLRFDGRDVTLYVQACQGSFPNFATLIPRDADRKASFTAPAAAVRDALAKMGTVVRGGKHDSGIVRFTGAYGDSKLQISAKNEEIGDAFADARGELDIQDDMLEQSGGMKFAANINYLTPAARDCGDTFRFSFFGSSSQCRIDHDRGSEVIMPMFVQW